MLILSNVQPCFYFHRRRKLFNIGGAKPSAANFNTWGGGGEVFFKST